METVSIPKADPDQKTLVEGSGTGRSTTSWTIPVARGPIWVALNCRGAGTLRIRLDPTTSFAMLCESSSVTPILNELKVKEPDSLTVSVTGPSAVSWGLRITQPTHP